MDYKFFLNTYIWLWTICISYTKTYLMAKKIEMIWNLPHTIASRIIQTTIIMNILLFLFVKLTIFVILIITLNFTIRMNLSTSVFLPLHFRYCFWHWFVKYCSFMSTMFLSNLSRSYHIYILPFSDLQSLFDLTSSVYLVSVFFSRFSRCNIIALLLSGTFLIYTQLLIFYGLGDITTWTRG